MSIGCDEAFTRFASRADAAIVINHQSRLVNPGRVSVNTNSSSQSSAASLACSEPNNSVTALMNAPSSRSAMVINLANVGLSLFVSSSTILDCVSCIAILDSQTPEAPEQRSGLVPVALRSESRPSMKETDAPQRQG